MCFMFVDQINVIFMRPLYEAVIFCDCIIKDDNVIFFSKTVTSHVHCFKISLHGHFMIKTDI